MAHQHSLEALNRTLTRYKERQTIRWHSVTLLGDFSQTLPVIPRSTYADQRLLEIIAIVA